MRKLTPYDDVVCFCKTRQRATRMNGSSVEAADDCECIATISKDPMVLARGSYARYRAAVEAQKLKLTKFKVNSILVPTDIMAVVRT